MGLEMSKHYSSFCTSFIRSQPIVMGALTTLVEYRLFLFLVICQFLKKLWHFAILTCVSIVQSLNVHSLENSWSLNKTDEHLGLTVLATAYVGYFSRQILLVEFRVIRCMLQSLPFDDVAIVLKIYGTATSTISHLSYIAIVQKANWLHLANGQAERQDPWTSCLSINTYCLVFR